MVRRWAIALAVAAFGVVTRAALANPVGDPFETAFAPAAAAFHAISVLFIEAVVLFVEALIYAYAAGLAWRLALIASGAANVASVTVGLIVALGPCHDMAPVPLVATMVGIGLAVELPIVGAIVGWSLRREAEERLKRHRRVRPQSDVRGVLRRLLLIAALTNAVSIPIANILVESIGDRPISPFAPNSPQP